MKKEKKNLSTIIGQETKITGDIITTGGIRIDGKVIGKIEAEQPIIVGKNAIIEGDIIAKNSVISGVVKGNIISEKNLELKNHAKIKGDIVTAQLTIETGAVYEGKCSMNKKEIKKDAKKEKQ